MLMAWQTQRFQIIFVQKCFDNIQPVLKQGLNSSIFSEHDSNKRRHGRRQGEEVASKVWFERDVNEIFREGRRGVKCSGARFFFSDSVDEFFATEWILLRTPSTPRQCSKTNMHIEWKRWLITEPRSIPRVFGHKGSLSQVWSDRICCRYKLRD